MDVFPLSRLFRNYDSASPERRFRRSDLFPDSGTIQNLDLVFSRTLTGIPENPQS